MARIEQLLKCDRYKVSWISSSDIQLTYCWPRTSFLRSYRFGTSLTANRASPLSCWPSILHSNDFGILHFPFCTAFHTISLHRDFLLSWRFGKYKQQWVSVKGAKRDAEKSLAELLHQLDNGTYIKPGKITLAEYLERWLKDYVCPNNLALRTAEGYESITRCHLITLPPHTGTGEYSIDPAEARTLTALLFREAIMWTL
jgi:hypothetical protein